MERIGDVILTQAGLVAFLLFMALVVVTLYFKGEVRQARADRDAAHEERKQANEAAVELARQYATAVGALTTSIETLRERLKARGDR